jgi:signal transduction histidine kinase
MADTQKEQIEELQRLLKIRTAALGMASHELRTPLSKVFAAAELIQMLAQQPPLLEAASEILDAAEQMKNLLEDIASYAELAGSKPRDSSDELDAQETLAEIARSFNADIAISAESSVPRLKIDRLRFSQIATNLISNAVKASATGHVEVYLSVDEARKVYSLVLSVEDDGPGISAEEQARIWEPFHRSSGSFPRGAGLGLSVVKLCVDQLGGSIDVASVPGQGAKFTVRLPVEEGKH